MIFPNFPRLCVLLLALLCFCLGAPARAANAPRVLCISDSPETTEVNYYSLNGAYIRTLNHFLSPQKILAPAMQITQVSWLDAPAALKNIGKYDALLLWDAPAKITDKRNSDPLYRDLNVISDDAARAIADWVRNGGALVVAGGVTNYGDGDKRLGSADARQGDLRHYFGLSASPLAAILPVEIPAGVSLRPFADAKNQRLQTAATPPDALTAGLNFNDWGFDAYHRVVARDGAQVFVVAGNGDPLVAGIGAGKGRVLCVMAAPHGNTLVANDWKRAPAEIGSPLWPQEAILWNRALHWSLKTPYAPSAEAQTVARYKALIAAPPVTPLTLRQQEFPYGTHVLNQAMPFSIRDLALKYYADLNMNHLVIQGTPTQTDKLAPYLENYTAGLKNNSLYSFMHAEFSSLAREKGHDPKDYATVTLPSGQNALHYGQPYADPFSPLVQKLAAEGAAEILPVMAKYPNVRGFFFEDEWAWIVGYRNAYEKNPGIGSYSSWANERYKKLTGQDAPPPVYREPGYVAPEDDEWLRWTRLTRQDAYFEFNEIVKREAKKQRKDWVLSNYPGGFEGNLDVMLEEIYLDCWKESELDALARLDTRANFREDARRDKHPMWALIGIFRMPEDKSVYPESLRLQIGTSLAGGAKGITLWNAQNLWAPWMQHPDRAPLDAEAKRWGDYLHRFGPMFSNLKKAPSPVWMMSGWFWVNSFDNYLFVPPTDMKDYDMERPWWNFQVDDVAVPATLRAGLQTEFVTEKQLMSAELFQKKAVILPGLLYCRQGVVDNLEKYIAGGGKVYVDESTKVVIKGAQVLPVDFSKWHFDVASGKRAIKTPTEATYREQRALRESYVSAAIPVLQKQVRDEIGGDVKINDPAGAFRILENGDTKYLFVFNSDTDNGHVFNVSLGGSLGALSAVYDVETGQKIKQFSDKLGPRFDVDLSAGGWKVFALAPSSVAGVRIETAKIEGETLKLRARVLADKTPVFRAAVPLKITLRGAQGDTVIYRATDAGVLDISIPLQGLSRPRAVEVETMLGAGRAVRAVP